MTEKLTQSTTDTLAFLRDYGVVSEADKFKIQVDLGASKRIGQEQYASPTYLGLFNILARSVAVYGFPTLITFLQHRKNALRRSVWNKELGMYWTSPMLMGYIGVLSQRYAKIRDVRQRLFRQLFGSEAVDVDNQLHCEALFMLPKISHEPQLAQQAFAMYKTFQEIDDPQLLSTFHQLLNSDLFQVQRVPASQVVKDWTYPNIDSNAPAYWDDRTDAFMMAFSEAWSNIQTELVSMQHGLLHLLPVDDQVSLASKYTDDVIKSHFPEIADEDLEQTHLQTATWFEENKSEPQKWLYD